MIVAFRSRGLGEQSSGAGDLDQEHTLTRAKNALIGYVLIGAALYGVMWLYGRKKY
jgi:hypothetical protein